MSLYGINEIFGGNSDLIDFDSSEEEEEFYLQRSMQYNDPRWTQKSNQIRHIRKKCERCNSHDDLQVHHLRYFSNRKIWEYGDEHLQILCRSCHAKEHNIFDPRGNHEDKNGPVEIIFTRGEHFVIETGDQRYRPNTSGASKVTIE